MIRKTQPYTKRIGPVDLDQLAEMLTTMARLLDAFALLCLSEIKHAHTDDGVRQEMA